MSEKICCQEVIDLRATVRNGRYAITIFLALATIGATVYIPRYFDGQDSMNGKLDVLVETTHHTELKVEHIGTEQVSLRRDLEAHMRRTEERIIR